MTHILTAAVATGDGSIMNVRADSRDYPRLVRASIAGVATVQLWGRMDATDTWFPLGTAFTATGVQSIALPPQVKFTVAAWTSGPVDGWVDAYPTQ